MQRKFSDLLLPVALPTKLCSTLDSMHTGTSFVNNVLLFKVVKKKIRRRKRHKIERN